MILLIYLLMRLHNKMNAWFLCLVSIVFCVCVNLYELYFLYSVTVRRRVHGNWKLEFDGNGPIPIKLWNKTGNGMEMPVWGWEPGREWELKNHSRALLWSQLYTELCRMRSTSICLATVAPTAHSQNLENNVSPPRMPFYVSSSLLAFKNSLKILI